jgi:hypothetical protein
MITKQEAYTKISELCDRINQLVYQLYGLTEKEIALVEGVTKNNG